MVRTMVTAVMVARSLLHRDTWSVSFTSIVLTYNVCLFPTCSCNNIQVCDKLNYTGWWGQLGIWRHIQSLKEYMTSSTTWLMRAGIQVTSVLSIMYPKLYLCMCKHCRPCPFPLNLCILNCICVDIAQMLISTYLCIPQYVCSISRPLHCSWPLQCN